MKDGKRKLFSIFFVMFVFASVSLSAREEENLERVLRFLEQIPIPVTVYERSLLAEFGGFGSSLLVSNQIDDTEEPDGTFVFAVPLSAKFAVDTALAMIERFSGSKNHILVAFLGEETNVLPKDMGGITHRGLRDLLTLADMPENWVICYFDANSPPGEIVINHGIRGYVTPLELITPLPHLFTSFGIPWSFEIRQNTIFKLGLVEGPEALSIIWEEEVHGFILSGRGENGNTILPGDLANLLLEYAGYVNFPILNPEVHYSFLVFPEGRVFFVSELIKVVLMLATLGLLLLLYLFYSARYSAVLRFHTRLFPRYFMTFIILLSFLVVSIKFSGFLYSFLSSVLNMPQRVPNYAGLVFTIVLSLLFFSFSPYLLNLIRFPLRERFYKFAAVIFIIFGMLSATLLDFSYIPVFLIVFVFFFLGTSVSNPLFVFLFTLSLPVFALVTLFNVFVTDSERLTALFINSTWTSFDSWLVIFHTALLSLPAFLLAKRGFTLSRIFLRRVIKLNRKTRRRIIPAMIGVTILLMIVQIIYPVQEIPSERRFIDSAFHSEINEILALNINDVVFLDSRIITLNLEAKGSPVRFDVSIFSTDDRILLPIYLTPVPFVREEEGRRIDLLLGEHPPNPLVMEIVVPLAFHGRLELAAIYNTWDPEIDPWEKPVTENYVLRLSRSAYL